MHLEYIMPNRKISALLSFDDMDGFRPGFRFYPTEEELVLFYLRNKLEKTRQDMDVVIPVLDVYSFEPWQLPEQARISDEEQWFFFYPKQQREAQGGRPTRTTASGYWKATGSLTCIYSSSSGSSSGGGGAIGTKRTMVFYNGRAPHGTKTKWKMNEYKAYEHDSTGPTSRLHDEFSLCRIYINAGCLRSFDRRPPANGVPSDRQTTLAAVEPQEGSSQPTTSLDSSASGEQGPGGDDVDWMHFQDIDWEFFDSI